MAGKTIIFHIGHGKTGSSALQSCLARNHEKLKLHGYLYPYHPSFKNAQRGYISAGNISPSKDPDWWSNQVLSVINEFNEYHTYIYSAESLFSNLAPVFENHGSLPPGWSIKILLAVRNPIEMMASHHQQAVKRGGYSGSLRQFMCRLGFKVGALHNSARLLTKLESKNIDHAVINYSRLRTNVISSFLDEMNLANIVDVNTEKDGIVNRSLSAQELSLVSSVNTVFGPKVGFRLSDALVNELPAVQADRLHIGQSDIEQIKSVNMEALLEVNKRLSSDMGLTFEYVPTVEYDIQDSLDSEQVEIVQRILFKVSERRRRKMSRLDSHQVAM